MNLSLLRHLQTLTLLCLLGSSGAWASAGKILFASGEASAEDAQSISRTLRRGDVINSGDTLITGAGKLQIRFTDGGLVSLQEHSRFIVDEYSLAAPGEGGDKAAFSLLKGGLRAVTGTIGVRSRETYSVTTPVATIGIRGTGFTLRYCSGDCAPVNGQPQPDGLYVSTQDGIIYVANAAGIIELAIGQAAFVASRETPPQPIDTPPLLLPPADDGSGTPVYVAGEQVTGGEEIPDVFDIFTPRSVFDMYAAQNLIGTYDVLAGGTTPTDQYGTTGTFLDGQIFVYFGDATISGWFDISIMQPGGSVPNTLNAGFGGSFLPGTTLFTGDSTGIDTSLNVNVSGGLLGDNAEGLLMNYSVEDPGVGQTITGTQAFEGIVDMGPN
ncbi:MAG: FecR family protein [Pseudomonadota bacterium]